MRPRGALNNCNTHHITIVAMLHATPTLLTPKWHLDLVLLSNTPARQQMNMSRKEAATLLDVNVDAVLHFDSDGDALPIAV